MKTKIIRFTSLGLGLLLILYILLILIKSSYALSVGVAANTNYHLALNEALSQNKTISNTYEISKEISVYSLYLPYLSYLERHNKYFKKCKMKISLKPLFASFSPFFYFFVIAGKQNSGDFIFFVFVSKFRRPGISRDSHAVSLLF